MHFKWTIGAKLLASSAMALTLTIAISAVGLLSIASLGARLHSLIHGTARKQALAGEVQLQLASMLSLERGIRLRTYMGDNAQVDAYHGEFAQTADKLNQAITAMLPLLVTPEGRTLATDLQSLSTSIVAKNEEIFRFCKAHQLKAAADLDASELRPLVAQAESRATRLVQMQGELMAKDDAAAVTAVDASWWTLAGVLLLSILTTGGSYFVVHRMTAQLRRNVESLTRNAEGVASAADQVSSSSQALAESASSQAASLEETSASSEQVHAVARRNMDCARTTTDIVEKSQLRSVEANQQLDKMVEAMDEINQSSEKISKIIKVIDEIAFQTNILALNAAVEAARAGESGLGFAVVADEVRSLAQRCAQAAKDTANLIEASLASSSGGKQRVALVADAVRALTSDSGGIRTLVDEISAGSEEQARGMKLIAGSLSRMEQSTQATAASAQQGAAGAAELNSQSRLLKGVVEQLGGMVNGASEHGRAEPVSQRKPAASVRREPMPAAVAPVSKTLPKKEAPSRRVAIVTSVKGPVPAREIEQRMETDQAALARQSFPLEEDFKDF